MNNNNVRIFKANTKVDSLEIAMKNGTGSGGSTIDPAILSGIQSDILSNMKAISVNSAQI